MDPVLEIKARLPIEDLVGQYCQLHKKGKQLKCLCPFHNDKHPSMLVSPDKGIAYCFACNSGGDIFSFYQKIEGVDFQQAIKDLAEKTGVKVTASKEPIVKKDERDRFRECLLSAQKFYASNLEKSDEAKKYLTERGIPKEQIKEFGLGVAPDSFNATYDHLLKAGFSKSEILGAGLGIQKEMQEEKIYDRFRHRLMFPISDHQGKLVGFGGRTLGDDDAKYINSAEGPLYHKASVLYGLDKAKEAMRNTKRVILVEGYFDVLACHRVGHHNVVAVSGTAFTEQHVKLLKRHCETVVLCLDQDKAGIAAAQRAFDMCAREGLAVHAVVLPDKDPADTAQENPDLLKESLATGDVPYLDYVIQLLTTVDLTASTAKRSAMQRVLPLLDALSSSVMKEHYLQKLASVLGTTVTALSEDMKHVAAKPVYATPASTEESPEKPDTFSSTEVVLALLTLYPKHLHLLERLIPPENEASAAIYHALKALGTESEKVDINQLDLPGEVRERFSILLLFCEQNNLVEWSDALALQEITRNCHTANRTFLQQKKHELSRELRKAKAEGRAGDEQKLSTKFQEVLKLERMAL